MKTAEIIERLRDLSLRTARAATLFARRCLSATRTLCLRAWNSDGLRRFASGVRAVARVAIPAVILGYVATSFLGAAVVTVPPTEIAVIQRNWGPSAGVVPRAESAGKVVTLPGRDTVHRLNARTHFLRFGMKSEGNDLPSLELRSSDGLEIRVGATVPYRITDGEAHAIVADGRRSTYPLAARAAAERVLVEEFAQLDRTGWSDVEARRSIEEAALEGIREAFAPFHLTPLGVHVTASWFPPMYEVELQEQKLLEQRILTDEMLGRLDESKHALLVMSEAQARGEAELSAEFDFRMEEVRLELEEAVREVQREAHQYRFERETEAENLYAKAVAEGQLAIDEAEALRERLAGEALETDGGRLLLARDAASNLRFKSVSLDANHPDVPSVIDLDALSRLLIGE
ncbi:MAG: SPFH domain-containing protein [Planctomycetota bacterium]